MKTLSLFLKVTLGCGTVLGLALLLLGHSHTIEAETTMEEHVDMVQAYSLFNYKCLGCHADVTDPEKKGLTRDEWFIVVNLMKGHGANLTQEESETIVGLLYALRPGLEKDPG